MLSKVLSKFTGSHETSSARKIILLSFFNSWLEWVSFFERMFFILAFEILNLNLFCCSKYCLTIRGVSHSGVSQVLRGQRRTND